MWIVEFANRQNTLAVPERAWRALVEKVLAEEQIGRAEISIAIVHDGEMHELNRQFLEHDYPTDVLSFVLEQSDNELIGEIIVSSDTAVSRAPEFGWSAADELTMYVLHGLLHLAGYDDKDPVDRAQMRAREKHFLELFGLRPSEPSL